MPEVRGDSQPLEAQKISTGILLGKIPCAERRVLARELHESLLDLPSIWAPEEVFEHESIAYRLKGRAFMHMAPPLHSEEIEIHVLEGLYALSTLREMASRLPPSAEVAVLDPSPHRHAKGGELVIRVLPDNFHEAFQFVLRLYRRARGV